MGLAVVRCPACRGASHVDAAALGLTVQCPRCDVAFVAVEEAEVVVPTRPSRNPTLTPPEPPRPRRRPLRYEPEPEQVDEPKPSEDYDPHRHPAGPLPASVLIGLALLPFAIPVLWLLGPVLIGEPPVLSVATAVALAVAASALCLAVIYTIDWTPGTRIKGVLMLVALAYFAAVSLYFIKKEMVDQVKKMTGTEEGLSWNVFNQRKEGDYQVKMPGRPDRIKDQHQQPIPSLNLICYKSLHQPPILGSYTFVVGSVKLPARATDPMPGTDAWFDRIIGEIVDHSGGQLHAEFDPQSNSGWPTGPRDRNPTPRRWQRQGFSSGSRVRHSRLRLLPVRTGAGNASGR